jgi:hypothetical protein
VWIVFISGKIRATAGCCKAGNDICCSEIRFVEVNLTYRDVSKAQYLRSEGMC